MVDQNAMVDSLIKQMEARFAGGAEALSKTTSGMWSTVTGVTKNSLAKIVGVTDEGAVRSGSSLDKLRKIIQKVADKFTQWQQDGTIERIGAKIDKIVTVAIGLFKKLSQKVKDLINSFRESEGIKTFLKVLSNVLIVLGAFIAVSKIANGVMALRNMWTKRVIIVQGTLNALTKAWNLLAISNPWVLAIAAIIAGLVLLYAKCEPFREFINNSISGIKNFLSYVTEGFQNMFPTLSGMFSRFWDGVKGMFLGVWDFIVGLLSGDWERVWDGAVGFVKGLFKGLFNFITAPLGWITDFIGLITSLAKKIGGWKKGKFEGKGGHPDAPNYATGTSYFRGGLAEINEGGRGEIVNLPNGSQVIPHSLSKNKINGGVNINVNLTITGDVIGEHGAVSRIADSVGQRIAQRLAII